MSKVLSQDEKELLVEITRHEGWKALLRAVEIESASIANKVLSYNLSEGAQGLAYEKARAEGAQLLLSRLRALKK